MNQIQTRFLLFLIGCMGTRLAFTFLAKEISLSYLPYIGYLALLPVLGWFYIIFIGSRDTGAEVFGERIWWKNLRIIHMVLYSTFAYLAINKNKDAWLVLLTDTLFGLVSFIIHHYNDGNFSKLF